MGLFDRRDRKRRGKADDFDSPVEEIDLSQPFPGETSSDDRPAASGADAAALDDDDELLEPPTDQIDADSPIIARAASRARYGVDQAIELLKSLPDGDLEMAVLVVKRTLQSANIEIPPIIEDADQRLAYCQNRGSTLTRELSELEREVAWRREEIARLERDFHEITIARERLILAEKVSLTQAEQQVADTRDISEVTSSEMLSEVVNPVDGDSAAMIQEIDDGPTEATVDPSGSHEAAPVPARHETDETDETDESDESDEAELEEITVIPGTPPRGTKAPTRAPSSPLSLKARRGKASSVPPPLPSVKARPSKPRADAAAKAERPADGASADKATPPPEEAEKSAD